MKIIFVAICCILSILIAPLSVSAREILVVYNNNGSIRNVIEAKGSECSLGLRTLNYCSIELQDETIKVYNSQITQIPIKNSQIDNKLPLQSKIKIVKEKFNFLF